MLHSQDPSGFFRAMAVRICARLDIGAALHSCLQYLQPWFPADEMALMIVEPGLGAMRTIAVARPDGAEQIDVLTPLPPEVTWSAGAGEDVEKPPIRFYNDPADDPVTRRMLEFNGIDPARNSVIVVPLLTSADLDDGQFYGSLAIRVERRDAYGQEHVDLLAPLADLFAVAMSNALRHRELRRLKDSLLDDNRRLQRDLSRQIGDEIIGQDFGLRSTIEKVTQVAPRDSPVLLLGETGVGKDVIAHAVHRLSARADGPFVAVNSGAIPESLLDSELFGHEKGAFTGALTRKRGRFERADGGSIFLDEIGELPAPAQVRLLRVLQNREIERVGGTEVLPANVRVIAATHRNLQEMVTNGDFRQDLWFRLNVFPIVIPPLRDRKQDIPALVSFFVERKAQALRLPGKPAVASGAIDVLLDYHWPGNIRELENVIERALIVHDGGPLRFDSVLGSPALRRPDGARPPAAEAPLRTLDAVTRDHIEAVLQATGHKIHGPAGAAEVLGLNASTLRNRMNRLGIRYRRAERGRSRKAN